MTMIQCYAPTNDSDENSKDTFYEQLQPEIISTHSHDMLIVMGDLSHLFISIFTQVFPGIFHHIFLPTAVLIVPGAVKVVVIS